MSLTINQELRYWKTIESSIRLIPVKMNGHLLSTNDRYRVCNAYVLWAHVCKDLIQDARICSNASLATWVEYLCTQDVASVMSSCKQMLACVRRWNSHMGAQGLDSFKHYLREQGIALGDRNIMPIWHLLYRFCVDFSGFQVINTFLSFTSRLTLEDVTWIEDSAILSYIEYENQLKTQTYNEKTLSELNSLAKDLFKHYRVVGIPKHGNGATSTTPRGSGVDSKFSAMQMTFGLRHLEKWFDTYHPLIPGDTVSGNELKTRIMFVPKGIDKKRVISAEPVANMYYQQMLFQSLDKMFQEDHRWHIDLHNQEWNRDLAMRGSRDLDYGTIDLSNASDSVTHTLVRAIMKGIPAFSHWERCRTRLGILPDDTVLSLEKYAPMGSALCFPVECIVFSLIVQLASKRCQVDHYFRVYGDDIVVHRSIFDEVLRLLEELHFSTNLDKTFEPGSEFTESCGIECFQGIDVSPTRIPRFYDPLYYTDDCRRTSPGRVMGVITFCNTLKDSLLYKTRSYVLHQLLEYFPTVPFSLKGEIGLASDSATNFHLEKKWNRDTQVFHYACLSLVADEDTVVDDRRYQHLLERYSHTTRRQLLFPEDRIDVKAGDSHSRLKQRNLPLDYYL